MIEREPLADKKARLSEAKRALLARRIRDSRTVSSVAPADSIRRREEPGEAPLSFAQQRLWFLDQLAPGSTAYNCPTALRLEGPLAVAALAASLDEIVRRHESLRSVVVVADGEPVQRVLPAVPVAVPLIDLSSLDAGEALRQAGRLAAGEAGLPFRLATGPLLRACLLRLAVRQHVLLLTVHHIAWDGWSAAIFSRELVQLYRALSTGRPPALPEPGLQYADYASWQRRWMTGGVLAKQLDYWRRQLADPPGELALPFDRPRSAVPGSAGGAVAVDFPRQLTESLRALASRHEVTLFMVLLAAYQALLCRLTGQEDILVGTSIAGRNRVELEGLIGFFVNPLVLRGELAGDPSWHDFLRRVRERAIGAFAHEDLPFEKLVEELQPERSLSRSPFFQTAFAFQSAAPPPLGLLPGLTLDPFENGVRPAKFELTLDVVDQGARLGASLEYNADLFEPTTVQRIARQLLTLCAGLAAHPAWRLAQLPLLTETELHQLIHEWSAPAGAPSEPAGDLLAGETGRVAVRCGEEEVTYGELAARSNQLAHLLRSRGAGPEVAVGLCVERSVEMIVGLVAILRAGGVCVPHSTRSTPPSVWSSCWWMPGSGSWLPGRRS